MSFTQDEQIAALQHAIGRNEQAIYESQEAIKQLQNLLHDMTGAQRILEFPRSYNQAESDLKKA